MPIFVSFLFVLNGLILGWNLVSFAFFGAALGGLAVLVSALAAIQAIKAGDIFGGNA